MRYNNKNNQGSINENGMAFFNLSCSRQIPSSKTLDLVMELNGDGERKSIVTRIILVNESSIFCFCIKTSPSQMSNDDLDPFDSLDSFLSIYQLENSNHKIQKEGHFLLAHLSSIVSLHVQLVKSSEK